MKKMRLIIILVFVLIIAIICGIVVSKSLKNGDSVSKGWEKLYLDYLENDISNAVDRNIFLTESKLYDDPLLVMYGETFSDILGKTFHINIYTIENDEVINKAHFGYGCSTSDECDIKFMYDVEHDEYNYYYYSKSSESYITYKTLDSLIIEYGTKNEEELTKNPNYIKYEYSTNPQASFFSNKTYVIDTGMKLKEFTYKEDSKYIKDQFGSLTNSYKKIKELGKKYAKEIEKQLEKINKEENNQTEENNSNNDSFKVGTYTLQYGKYRACFNSSNCREFTLNSDGTAIFDGTKKYFRVEEHNFGQGVEDMLHPAIVFSDTEGGSPGPNVYTPYVSTPDCLMTDGEIECVNYIGE